MNLAIGIAELMVNHGMGHKRLDADIALVFVGNQYGVRNIHVIANELGEALGVEFGLINGAGYNFAATFDDAHNWNFRGTTSALVSAALRPRSIALARLAANVALIHFDDAAHKFRLFKHGVADTHPHGPTRTLVDLNVAGNLALQPPFQAARLARGKPYRMYGFISAPTENKRDTCV